MLTGIRQRNKAVSQIEPSHNTSVDTSVELEEKPLEDIGLLKEKIKESEAKLQEKDASLAEERQKVIQQRHLYEQSHSHEKELLLQMEDVKSEHVELVALREYVYSLKEDDAAEKAVTFLVIYSSLRCNYWRIQRIGESGFYIHIYRRLETFAVLPHHEPD